ncbi:AfsA-related hotdog domain-containing protein [Solwaraspora sp. WMMB335]|uniref:AfsA-related hotdog domain-containing protein n=1 Tax=Solwaraspora sp. WMMB335 TaxID=3404118 RepID=UPI003B967448
MTDTRLPPLSGATVDPAAVHRRHADTVFLTEVRPYGGGGYAAAAVLPAGHPYYSAHAAAANRHLDPMLLLEACRQVLIYVGHDHLDLAEDTRFLMDACELDVPADGYLHRPVGPTTLTMRVDVSVVRAGSRIRSVTARCELSIGGARIGRVTITSSVVSPAAYPVLRRRARDGSPPPWSDQLSPRLGGAVAPATVGRLRSADVLLAELRQDRDEAGARVLLPFGHPGLFDHRLDHVPGTLLIEAARQLGAALSPEPATAVMTGFAGSFHTFAELDAPVHLTARAGADGGLSVAVVQGGAALAAFTVLTGQQPGPSS